MSAGSWGPPILLLGLVVLAIGAGVAGWWMGWWSLPVGSHRSPPEVRTARCARRSAARIARRARWSRRRELGAADRSVRGAERTRASLLAKLQERIDGLADPRGRRLADFAGCILHEFVLITPGGQVPLDGVEASVDTAGNLSVTKRATLTRMAAGGLLLGGLGAVLSLGFQKKERQDTRELYLLLDAGAASVVVQADPDAGAEVRRFASAVNAFATDVDARRRRRGHDLAEVRQERARVEADLTAIETAMARREAITAGTRTLSALVAAEAALARARDLERSAIERWRRSVRSGERRSGARDGGPQPLAPEE
jgi:hypothetical protein